MKLQMNLLENSLDYLHNSLDFYHVADEYGVHDPQRSDKEKKEKWKTAYVFLVQAFELILKECLRLISPVLIAENIDRPYIENQKTVSFSQLITRFNNFYSLFFSAEEEKIIITSARLRNEFMHYKVQFNTPELKVKYASLFELHSKIYVEILDTIIPFRNEQYNSYAEAIINFSKKLTVYRGQEVLKSALPELKKDMDLNQVYTYFKTLNEELIERIKYGNETEILIKKGVINQSDYTRIDFNYCGDCYTELGKYHLDYCDLEICPKCFGQKLTCGCDLTLCDKEGNVFILAETN